MTNHYHLLIETPEGNLSLGMRQLNGVYTQLFNKRHGRTGHLFQGRYKAILIQKDSHLLEVSRYVVLNPVRAKMATKPEEYAWSSYLATAGRAKPHPSLTPEWVLGQFSGKQGKAEREYRQFVSWGIGKPTIWTKVRGQALLGEEGFVDQLVDHLRKHKDIPEIPRSQRYAHRPALEKLFSGEAQANISKRRAAVQKAVEQYGYTLRQIAAHLSLHDSSISKILKGSDECHTAGPDPGDCKRGGKMKFQVRIAAMFFLLAAFAFAGCGGGNGAASNPATYTVTFNSQGGSAVAAQTVNPGEKAAEPTAPAKTYFTFAGWYKEAACINAWNFNSEIVSGNVTLFAKWNDQYALRDTGPAGGLIFYLNPNYATDGWRYLEAAPSDQSTGVQWYNGSYVLINAWVTGGEML